MAYDTRHYGYAGGGYAFHGYGGDARPADGARDVRPNVDKICAHIQRLVYQPAELHAYINSMLDMNEKIAIAILARIHADDLQYMIDSARDHIAALDPAPARASDAAGRALRALLAAHARRVEVSRTRLAAYATAYKYPPPRDGWGAGDEPAHHCSYYDVRGG